MSEERRYLIELAEAKRETERDLLLAVAEEAVQARRNGLNAANVPADESLEQMRRLWRAADAVIAHRKALGGAP